MLCLIFNIPFEERFHAVFNFHFMGPTEAVELRHIAEFAWSAVGFGGIKSDSASEAHGFRHELGKLLQGEPLGHRLSIARISLERGHG